MNTKPPAIGIDFGTTNSSMAWFNPRTGQAEVLPNSEGEQKTPSLVYFGKDTILVGKPVEELLEDSEHYDEEERLDNFRRTVGSIKRGLVSPPVVPIPGRKPVRPAEVVAEILGKLKRDAEEGHFHEEVERAVITCPAIFDRLQRKVVFDAAALAGFKVVDLVEEPVAAAMAVAHMGQKVGRGVLVYDLGAGTFDLAVVARESDGDDETFRVALEPEGDPRCGGDDFDRALYDHFEGVARRDLGRPISLENGEVDLHFLRACRRQKERLTGNQRARLRAFLSDGTSFRAEMDRPTFEGLIRERVETTVQKTADLAKKAGERGHKVDTVVLIGGSSQVPLVARRLEETLPIAPRRFANRDFAVALGAAYYASVLEIPPGQQYRRALEISWADERLSREEVNHLGGLLEELELGGDEAAGIEREVLGSTIKEVLARQVEEYRAAVMEAWEIWGRLDALAAELCLSDFEAGGIRREITGDAQQVRAGSKSGVASRQMRTDSASGEPQVVDSIVPTLEGAFTQATVGYWLRGEGRTVSVGEDLVILETDAGNVEVEAQYDGVLETIVKREGHIVAPGDVLARIRTDLPREDAGPHGPNKAKDYAPVQTLRGHDGGVWSVSFGPDGQALASAGQDGTIKLWYADTGKLVRTITEYRGPVATIQVSPDGQYVAGGSEKSITLWDTRTGGRIRTFFGHEEPVTSVVFGPDGRTVASSGDDSTIRLWDTVTGKQLGICTSQATPIHSVAFSPDGRLLASGKDDGLVEVRDARSLELLLTLNHEGPVASVAFSPDGKTIASGGFEDMTVKLWDVETAYLILALTGHTGLVHSVAFSSDGHTLASGSHDDTIRLWDTRAGELLRTLRTSEYAAVLSVVFSPDGRRIASGNIDGTVRLWERV